MQNRGLIWTLIPPVSVTAAGRQERSPEETEYKFPPTSTSVNDSRGCRHGEDAGMLFWRSHSSGSSVGHDTAPILYDRDDSVTNGEVSQCVCVAPRGKLVFFSRQGSQWKAAFKMLIIFECLPIKDDAETDNVLCKDN